MRIETYVNGKLHGGAIEIFQSGMAKITNYKHGVENGVRTMFRLDVVISKALVDNGHSSLTFEIN